MTNAISSSALVAAAHALAATMPSSTLPIGPQLEAWALLVLGGELHGLGVKVNPAPAGPFYVRLNQHKTFKGPQSSWLDIAHKGRQYELHNALPVKGLSGAHHEIDVCLVQGAPKTAPIPFHAFRAGMECKQHTAAVSENVVRAVLGVCLEVSWVMAWPRRRPWAIVATNTSLSGNTRQLLDFYGIAFVGVDAATVAHSHPGIAAFAHRVATLL